MPYAKKKVEIPLCTTCAEAYNAKADAVIVVVEYAKECIAHYVDLDTITCLKKIGDKAHEGHGKKETCNNCIKASCPNPTHRRTRGALDGCDKWEEDPNKQPSTTDSPNKEKGE